jgi:FKBP-type peptidyl-prolyl cis-trans isomerase (trigger factor)
MNITVMPEFKLGNLKKIKIKKEEVKVEKKEVDDALDNILKNQKNTNLKP